MTIRLEIKREAETPVVRLLGDGDAVVLGRRGDAEVVLPAAEVSGRHARVRWVAGEFTVEDLGSTNGTWLGGRRLPLEPVRVDAGVEVRLGGFRLQWHPDVAAAPATGSNEDVAALVAGIHERLIQRLDLRRLDLDALEDVALRDRVRGHVAALVAERAASGPLPAGTTREALVQEVLDEALGLGPLEALLADPTVSEIMVNGADRIFIERRGRLAPSGRRFSSEAAVLAVLERIVAPVGRRIDESSPLVDARLADGSRVNAVIPPLAVDGPSLTIRKFREEALTVEDLVGFGSLTPAMASFLETCVAQRRNVLISGGTGSGKTTTLNVLSNFIPDGERVITVEDAAELRLSGAHVVRLEARPPNLEGRGAVPIRELVRNCLRMRPDRIVVGECRGGEALDMLQAMNTGHEGSLTTLHANTPRDALSRLETLVLMSGVELPVRAVREQIAAAVDVVVQQTRLSDGRRVVTAISEVGGLEGEVVTLTDVFRFERTGHDSEGRVLGAHRPTGLVPRFYEGLAERGVAVDLSIFDPDGVPGRRPALVA